MEGGSRTHSWPGVGDPMACLVPHTLTASSATLPAPLLLPPTAAAVASDKCASIAEVMHNHWARYGRHIGRQITPPRCAPHPAPSWMVFFFSPWLSSSNKQNHIAIVVAIFLRVLRSDAP